MSDVATTAGTPGWLVVLVVLVSWYALAFILGVVVGKFIAYSQIHPIPHKRDDDS